MKSNFILTSMLLITMHAWGASEQLFAPTMDCDDAKNLIDKARNNTRAQLVKEVAGDKKVESSAVQIAPHDSKWRLKVGAAPGENRFSRNIFGMAVTKGLPPVYKQIAQAIGPERTADVYRFCGVNHVNALNQNTHRVAVARAIEKGKKKWPNLRVAKKYLVPLKDTEDNDPLDDDHYAVLAKNVNSGNNALLSSPDKEGLHSQVVRAIEDLEMSDMHGDNYVYSPTEETLTFIDTEDVFGHQTKELENAWLFKGYRQHLMRQKKILSGLNAYDAEIRGSSPAVRKALWKRRVIAYLTDVRVVIPMAILVKFYYNTWVLYKKTTALVKELYKELNAGLEIDPAVRNVMATVLPGENRLSIYNELEAAATTLRNTDITDQERGKRLQKHILKTRSILGNDMSSFSKIWRTLKRSVNALRGKGFVTAWDQSKRIQPPEA